MHPTSTYIYINIHTFATTRSQHKITHITSNPILKHAYFLINSTYNTLTIRTLTLDILGYHKPTPIFHYTNSHHLSFGEHLHYLDLGLLEVPKHVSQLHFFFSSTFSGKHAHQHKKNTLLKRAKKGKDNIG